MSGERVYALLLRLYPRAFRAEYGGEMRRAFRDWRGASGQGGALRFWLAALGDVARSVPRAWADRAAERAAMRRAEPNAPPYGAAVVVALGVLALYAATLAPTVAFWDAGEYLSVAHVLGIPHPPGNPLFVLLAHGWEVLLAPTGLSPAVRINLFSATLSAAAHGLWFLVADRALAGWTDDRLLRRVGAVAAVLLSATAFTVWNQSDVNEKVYTVSLFTTALVTWLAFRWRDTGRGLGRLALVAFLIALTSTNHLMGVLVAPALVVLVAMVDARVLLRPRLWATSLPLAAVALSVQLFLPLRAAQRPLISEGEPTCESVGAAVASVYTWGGGGCEALSGVLRREQYAKPPITADPIDRAVPRSGSLLVSQLVNWAQYFDWQWGRSVAGRDPLFGGARPLLTLTFLLLGLLGARTQWRSDRAGAAYMAVLFATLSLGLVLYLNFKYGYSIANDRFPSAEMHEVRERDYFFLIGFSVWGVWAGMGLAVAWRRLAAVLAARLPRPRLAAAPVLGLAVLPLALNWGWASRADDWTARDWAYNALMSVEPYGVLITNGDNDSFPLWYLQTVEGVRKDVTVVLSPYLNTAWYPKQLRALTTPCAPGVDPAAAPTRVVCQRPFDASELPAALADLGWADGVTPPRDSIVPLSDDEIDRVAWGGFVAPAAMTLRAGALRTTIREGTTLLPADTFTAAILRATAGQRPVHFMPGAQQIGTLGLFAHTVREGVTLRIVADPSSDDDVVPLPDSPLSAVAGAAVDLPVTDTLLRDVFVHRGRVLDPGAPWVDSAVRSIPSQYLFAHYAAAQGHARRGDAAAARAHLERADWWQEIASGAAAAR